MASEEVDEREIVMAKRKRYSTKKLMGNTFVWDRDDNRYICLCPRKEDAVKIRTALNK